MKEQALRRSELILEEDAMRFETFLKVRRSLPGVARALSRDLRRASRLPACTGCAPVESPVPGATPRTRSLCCCCHRRRCHPLTIVAAALQEVDQRALDALRRAEEQSKQKNGVLQQLKQVNAQIQAVESDIAKYTDQLALCERYKEVRAAGGLGRLRAPLELTCSPRAARRRVTWW